MFVHYVAIEILQGGGCDVKGFAARKLGSPLKDWHAIRHATANHGLPTK